MYDFNTINNRRQTNSVKWNVKNNELPMWVADMDFKTAPEITAAFKEKIAQGIFGYENVPSEYFQAVVAWYRRQHKVELDAHWMLFVTGVVPAISSIVRRVTSVGDSVLVCAPVYNIFYNSIENSGRHVLSSDLVFKDGKYSIDWSDLEAKLAQPLTNLLIFCNPHNPIGLVWHKKELERLVKLCQKHHVILLSDEIHGDLVLKGQYTSVASLKASGTITLVSPSKTFNLAALHAATAIIPEENLRAQVNRGFNSEELAEPNLLAIPGTVAAYTQGEKWLVELKEVLKNNQQMVVEFLAQHLPQVKMVYGGATYLLWLDISAYTSDSKALATFIREKTGLYLSAGTIYRGNGNKFLRMNIACPVAYLIEGLQRLKSGLDAWSSNN